MRACSLFVLKSFPFSPSRSTCNCLPGRVSDPCLSFSANVYFWGCFLYFCCVPPHSVLCSRSFLQPCNNTPHSGATLRITVVLVVRGGGGTHPDSVPSLCPRCARSPRRERETAREAAAYSLYLFLSSSPLRPLRPCPHRSASFARRRWPGLASLPSLYAVSLAGRQRGRGGPVGWPWR